MNRIILSLLFCVAAWAQSLTSVTPAGNWSGTSGTFTFTFTNPPSPTTYFLFSFAPQGTAYSPGYIPAGTCTMTVWWSPTQTAVALAPVGSSIWYDNVGQIVGLESGGWYSSYSAPNGNGNCTIHSYADGSGWQYGAGNTLQFTIKVDFADSFSGPKVLYSGYRNCCEGHSWNDPAGGPFWIGPLLNSDNSVQIFTAGSLYNSFNIGPVSLPGSDGDDYAPSCSFINTTLGPRQNQNAYFVVGDTYNFRLTGPPGGSVVVTRTQNGAAASTLNLTLDSNGALNILGGVVQQNETGGWTEDWSIAGYHTPLLRFTVDPTGPQSTISSPMPGTLLPASTATFNWTAGVNAGSYALYVGTSPGAGNLFVQYYSPGTTSQVVSGLPSGIIYVRLWTYISGSWSLLDYTYYRI